MGVVRLMAAVVVSASVLGALPQSPARAGDGDGWGSLSGVGIGAGVFVTPRYEGSSDYRVLAAPIITPAPGPDGSDGRITVHGIDDLRLRLFELGGFEAGPLAGWRFGREETDSARLAGLGDVEGGLVVGGYMAYRIGILKPFLSYHHQVTGDDGAGVLRMGTEAKLVSSPGFALTGSAGASYADDNYMRSYFGVTPGQSLASLAGLRAFDAEAGFKDVFVGAIGRLDLSDRWTLRASVRYARLIGDAADSPVIETVDQWTAGVGLTYRFGLPY